MCNSSLIFTRKRRWPKHPHRPRRSDDSIYLCRVQTVHMTHDAYYDPYRREFLLLGDEPPTVSRLSVHTILMPQTTNGLPLELLSPLRAAVVAAQMQGYEQDSYVGVLFDPDAELFKPGFDYDLPRILARIELTPVGRFSMNYWTEESPGVFMSRWSQFDPAVVRFVRSHLQPTRSPRRIVPDGTRQIMLEDE